MQYLRKTVKDAKKEMETAQVHVQYDWLTIFADMVMILKYKYHSYIILQQRQQ